VARTLPVHREERPAPALGQVAPPDAANRSEPATFVVPDLIDDLVGRRDTAGLVRVGRFTRRSEAWAAALRFALVGAQA